MLRINLVLMLIIGQKKKKNLKLKNMVDELTRKKKKKSILTLKKN